MVRAAGIARSPASSGGRLEAAYEDNIPFLAGALSFDILLTAIPFVGLVLAVRRLPRSIQFAIHQLNVHELLERFLPESSGGEQGTFGFIERGLGDLVVRRGPHSPSWPRPCSSGSRPVCSGDCGRPERGVRYRGEPALAHRQAHRSCHWSSSAGALFLANAFASSTPGFFSQLLSLVLQHAAVLRDLQVPAEPPHLLAHERGRVAVLRDGLSRSPNAFTLYVARFVTFDAWLRTRT